MKSSGVIDCQFLYRCLLRGVPLRTDTYYFCRSIFSFPRKASAFDIMLFASLAGGLKSAGRNSSVVILIIDCA